MYIVYENPLCKIVWAINSNFSAISYELYSVVSAADKVTLCVGNFQRVI